MTTRPNGNFSKGKILLSTTIHIGVTDDFGWMQDWLDERAGHANQEIRLVSEDLALYATRHDGETYLALGHVRRFAKLVRSVGGQVDGAALADAERLTQLESVAGKAQLNGGEIRAIRLRQARGQ